LWFTCSSLGTFHIDTTDDDNDNDLITTPSSPVQISSPL